MRKEKIFEFKGTVSKDCIPPICQNTLPGPIMNIQTILSNFELCEDILYLLNLRTLGVQ